MFSVIIPLFNKERNITETLASVFAQSFENFEVIIVDDGSTDNSLKVVKEITDPRMRIVQKTNGGVSSARNRGIEEANNEWISFLDADDIWRNNHLATIVEMMEIFPEEKVFSTSFEFSDNRKAYKHPRATDIYKIEDYFRDAVSEQIIWTSVVTVNRKCFDHIGFFNERLSRGEDLDVWARLAKKYEIVKSSTVTAIYKMDAENKLTVGKSIYEKSILSIINLKGLNGYERSYFKRMLLKRMKNDVRLLDFKELFKIILKHNLELIR